MTTAGGTSGPVTAQLLGHGYPVRVLVCWRDARAERLATLGAEIVVGNLGDLADVGRALDGVRRAYLAPPFSPHMLSYGLTFAAASQEARLEAVVALSQWLANPQHPSAATRAHWHIDQALRRLPDVGVVTVNPGYFAENYLGALPYMAQLGVMPLPLGEGLNAPPSNEDIARVVVGALTDPAPHIGRVYRPTGPRLLAPVEIVAIFARALGRPVRYAPILPDWLAPKAVRLAGYDPFTAAQTRHYFRDYRLNAFGIGAPTDAVRAVGGRDPEDFEATIRRYVAARPEARRTAGRTAKALAQFLAVPVAPPYDLERLEGEWAPAIRGRYAPESPAWLATHKGPQTAAAPAHPQATTDHAPRAAHDGLSVAR